MWVLILQLISSFSFAYVNGKGLAFVPLSRSNM
jgi:hypothetical protein